MNLALATGPLAQAVGWALLHLVWQGALVAALPVVVLALLSGRSANLRYAVSCAALVLVVALGVATGVRSYPRSSPASRPVAIPSVVSAPPSPIAIRTLAPVRAERVRQAVRA